MFAGLLENENLINTIQEFDEHPDRLQLAKNIEEIFLRPRTSNFRYQIKEDLVYICILDSDTNESWRLIFDGGKISIEHSPPHL